MNLSDYNAWANRYGATFALVGPQYGAMFAAWFDVFRVCGYTLPELDAALLVVAQAPPEFPSQHLAAVHGAIRGRRSAVETEKRLAVLGRSDPSELKHDRGECILCSEAGCVIVPHPKLIHHGQWIRHNFSGYCTAAVLCRCWKGRRFAEVYERQPADYRERVPRQMTLDEYEKLNPRWRDQMQWLEDLQAAEAKAAKAIDKPTVFDEIVGRIKNRLAALPPADHGDAWEGDS